MSWLLSQIINLLQLLDRSTWLSFKVRALASPSQSQHTTNQTIITAHPWCR